jgi:hypothetical protein
MTKVFFLEIFAEKQNQKNKQWEKITSVGTLTAPQSNTTTDSEFKPSPCGLKPGGTFAESRTE